MFGNSSRLFFLSLCVLPCFTLPNRPTPQLGRTYTYHLAQLWVALVIWPTLEPVNIRETNRSIRSWSFLHNGARFPNYQVIYVVTVYLLGTFYVPSSMLITRDMEMKKSWCRPLRKGSITSSNSQRD